MIPEPYIEYIIKSLSSGTVDQSNHLEPIQHLEVQHLLQTTKEKLSELQDRTDLPWVWDAELQYEPWSDEEKNILREQASFLPPLKYQVSLKLTCSSQDDLTREVLVTLAPAELKVITLLNADIGRRIGDELDGRRPSKGERH
jgi:hypothetical protein